MSSPINEKSFNLYNRIQKVFSLSVAHFAFAATLLLRIRLRLQMTFAPVFAINISSIIRLRRIRILISQVKLITKITQTINLRRVHLSIFAREIIKFVITYSSKIPILIVSTARQKLVSSIIIKKIVLTINPTLAQFFTLGDYDPDTLGSMDTETLGELDYVET